MADVARLSFPSSLAKTSAPKKIKRTARETKPRRDPPLNTTVYEKKKRAREPKPKKDLPSLIIVDDDDLSPAASIARINKIYAQEPYDPSRKYKTKEEILKMIDQLPDD